jgi:hypothetical protein
MSRIRPFYVNSFALLVIDVELWVIMLRFMILETISRVERVSSYISAISQLPYKCLNPLQGGLNE